MVNKSMLRSTIAEVLQEHETEDGALVEDLVDRLSQDFADEVYDDEDGADEEE